MTDAAPTCLFLTVGGSPAPLLTAIAQLKPDHVVFVVSDGKNGQASSRDQVQIILEDCEWNPPHHEICEVAADDPDSAGHRIGGRLDDLARRKPGHRRLANYTGGTKSMSAALLLAAIRRDVEIMITAGDRPDLITVTDGTEAARTLSTGLIGLERDLDTALRLGEQGDYGGASLVTERLCKSIGRPGLQPSKDFNRRLGEMRDWARCMAAWDNFDHKKAWSIFSSAWDRGDRWAESLCETGHRDILEDLAKGAATPRVSLCQDLLENARRRMALGRYDDALGRLYRLVESCAQAQLYRRHGLHSGNLTEQDLGVDLAKRVTARWDHKLGRTVYELGLKNTMSLLARKDADDPVARAYFGGTNHGPEWLNRRNKSILAHGYGVIEPELVKEAVGWVQATMAPALGFKPMPPLPKSPRGDVRSPD